MGLSDYDSAGDMFDGGGPGQSGDSFEGGGAVSDIGNAMGGPSAFGGGSSGGGDGGDYNSGVGPFTGGMREYTRTSDLGQVSPVARGETPTADNYNGGNTLVSGSGTGTGTFFAREGGGGQPVFDYSEVGAAAGGTDANGDGYSDFMDENPNSTISEQEFNQQRKIARGLSFLMSPMVGLAGNTITKLQTRGLLPGRDAGYGGFDNATTEPGEGSNEGGSSEIDRRINAILGDDNMADGDKDRAIMDLLDGELDAQAGQERAEAGASVVQPMAEGVFGANEAVDPAGVFDNPNKFVAAKARNYYQNGVNPMNEEAGLIPDQPTGDPDDLNYDPVTAGPAAQAGQVDPQLAQGYEAANTIDDVMENGQADAAQGTVSDGALVDAEQVDVEGAATGTNADGTTNYLGEALNSAAQQNIGTVIDTSTPQGKILAEELGAGNYTDSKATLQGQMQLLQEQFTGPNGEPTIPAFAAGAAREVSRIAAFKGMSGTAATAAMSQALMEASLPIAQQDAQFFQSMTAKNLDNRQQMAVTKANVLSKMQLANLDARMTAAVNNSKAFLQMDLQNLDNEQQAEIINTQSRVQSILEDARSENAARAFTAEAQNSFTQFYDQLGSQIEQFNAEQKNAMERFNVGEINSAAEFNAQLENQREQFYADMQYNVDLSNARWRQTIETTDTQNSFEAAMMDVQNLMDLNREGMNRMWDREDAILDYTWRTSESELDREVQMYAAERGYELDERQIENQEDQAKGRGIFEAVKMGTDLLFGSGGGGGGLLSLF